MKQLINRKVLVSMFFVALTMLGVISYRSLSVELIPAMELPVLFIRVMAPVERDLQYVEREAVIPLEGAAGRLDKVEKIESRVMPDGGMVSVYFAQQADMRYAYLKLSEQVDAVRSRLPEGFMAEVMRVDMEQINTEFMQIQVIGEGGADRIRTLLEQEVNDRFMAVDGVASVQVFGGREKTVTVKVNRDELESYGLTMNDIRQQIRSGQQSKTFVGEVHQHGTRFFVNAGAEYLSPTDIGQIVIREDGPLLLSDIATISYGLREPDSFSRVNGNDVVTISLVRESQVNLIELSDKVKDELAAVNEDFAPRGLTLEIQSNSAEEIEKNIDQIIQLALIGGLLAIFILWIFLENLPLVLVVMVAMPVSVFGAFNFFYAADITINMLTLIGLALAMGMLIDNGVVVMENIYRMTSRGGKPEDIVVKGTSGIWRSVTAATFTTIVVFLPFVFATNQVLSEVARHVSVSIVSTLLVSLLVALVLIPTIVNAILKRQKGHSWRLSRLPLHNHLVQIYIQLLKGGLRHPARLVMGGLGLFFLVAFLSFAYSIAGNKPVEKSTVEVNVSMHEGSTLQKADELIRTMEERLARLNLPADVISKIYTDRAVITVEVDKDSMDYQKLSFQEIRSKVENELWVEWPGASVSFDTGGESGGGGAGMGGGAMSMLGLADEQRQVVIKGENFNDMVLTANDLVDLMKENLTSLDGVWVEGSWQRPEVMLDLDPYWMGINGVQPAQVVAQLTTLSPQTESGGTFKADNQEYDIMLAYEQTEEDSLERAKAADMQTLADTRIRTGGGERVELESFADIALQNSESQYHRVNQEKQIVVRFTMKKEVEGSRELEEIALKEIEELLLVAGLPEGVTATLQRDESTKEYYFLAGMAILLIFMILASVFESFSAPVVMLFTIPLAAVGSMLALLFTGNSLLNFNTFIGFLILLGVVVNNGIILIDYAMQLRRSGVSVVRSYMEAGMARLRPILITATTTIVAMLPLSLGEGEYVGALGAPFAITVIGGLVFSSVLTLVFVPAFGLGLERALNWIRSLKQVLRAALIGVWILLFVLIWWGSDMSVLWQMVTTVLAVAGVPWVLWFALNSLKRASSKLIGDGDDIRINIRNIVKVYGRPNRFRLEWKQRTNLRHRLLKVPLSSAELRAGLIWQIPLLVFLSWFSLIYLEDSFWQLFFWVVNYFVIAGYFEVLHQRWFKWRFSAGHLINRRRFLKIIRWTWRIGYPLVLLFVMLQSWKNQGGAVTIIVLWIIIGSVVLVSKKTRAGSLKPEMIRGWFKVIRRRFVKLVMLLPFAKEAKEPFKAVKGVSLELSSGMIGLLGPNGAGKTTIMRTLCGILDQSYGKIFINGFDTADYREELQGLIGYLPQEFGTYENMTALEFLDYQAILKNITDETLREERVRYVLKSVHMWERRNNKIGAYSGGMKQRIGIAMILLHLPRILVVDEPTAGLDPRERIRFRNLLVELSRERVVVFSTHIIEDISSSCNQVAVMSKGALRYWGEPRDMVNIAKGKVWQVEVSPHEVEEMTQRFTVIHHMNQGGQVRLRCLSSEKPDNRAVEVTAVLEDSYLWLLNSVCP
ncbi:efflux RND transporter permease subunit [Marinilabilia salmonicolor]|uniref:Multidrug efflux pump subunit AcrB n=1 Tax=Marinilabilia salmonicolor TaxID=989 RepID=A0A368VBC4_9BACT|nr:efflux RND transporter permease subunit [Marinilabilia salmonicolor]RCW38416.1 multidrug efflux pump subunit AcrB [Marinilabilia salmonicolor]